LPARRASDGGQNETGGKGLPTHAAGTRCVHSNRIAAMIVPRRPAVASNKSRRGRTQSVSAAGGMVPATGRHRSQPTVSPMGCKRKPSVSSSLRPGYQGRPPGPAGPSGRRRKARHDMPCRHGNDPRAEKFQKDTHTHPTSPRAAAGYPALSQTRQGYPRGSPARAGTCTAAWAQ
jgi:hypothetical protein